MIILSSYELWPKRLGRKALIFLSSQRFSTTFPHLYSDGIHLNPFNAKPTFIKDTRMQRILKTI